MPSHGTTQLLPQSLLQTNASLFYTWETFDHPRTIFEYSIASEELRPWSDDEADRSTSPLFLEGTTYMGEDGTTIPITLLSRGGTKTGEPGTPHQLWRLWCQ